MADTLWADVSYYQNVVDHTYPYNFFSFRANDGTFRDPHFYQNLAKANAKVKKGNLTGYFIYFVYEEDWQETLETFKSMVGKPSPYMAVMIDVESWGGKIRGSQSHNLNQLHHELVLWLNSFRPKALRKFYLARDHERVLAYANQYDRESLWPSYGDVKWTIANYSENPHLRDQIAHQFSQSFYVPPFGHCDINCADGYSAKQFATAIGILGKTPAESKGHKPPVFPLHGKVYGNGVGQYNGTKSLKHKNEIKTIQRALLKGGFAGKESADKWVDGHFGKQTAAAVTEFKSKYKFGNKKGYVGRTAWNRLVRL